MAGVKITDLPILSEPATDDVLYIVDATDNTSKQISFGNVKGALDIDSGLFTSTASDLVNLDSVDITEGTWMRVGESVTYGFYFQFILTTLGDSASFTIDIPQMLNDFVVQKGNSYVISAVQRYGDLESVNSQQIVGTTKIQFAMNGFITNGGGKYYFIGIYKR